MCEKDSTNLIFEFSMSKRHYFNLLLKVTAKKLKSFDIASSVQKLYQCIGRELANGWRKYREVILPTGLPCLA